MADLLVVLCVIISCIFVTFLYGVAGQVWYLIDLIPDIYLLLYINTMSTFIIVIDVVTTV